MRYVFPVDPQCPVVADFSNCLYNDPMSVGAPVGEIMEDFQNKHRQKCQRCMDYGLENVDVE